MITNSVIKDACWKAANQLVLTKVMEEDGLEYYYYISPDGKAFEDFDDAVYYTKQLLYDMQEYMLCKKEVNE